MPVLTSPPLIGGAGKPVTGRVAVQATAEYEWTDTDAVVHYVTTAPQAAVVRDGQFYDLTSNTPLELIPTPANVGMRVVLRLEEQGAERGEHVMSRIVEVPDVATVAWGDLVDMVPPVAGGDYVIPPWASDVLTYRDEAAVSATNAQTSANSAAASAADASNSASAAATSEVNAANAAVGVAVRNRTMLDPDNFAGATDRDKVQAAVNDAIADGYPSIGFTRMFDLTGAAPVSIDKNPWHDRRELKLVGLGGGIRKDDAGVIFTSATANTGDVAATGMKFQSVAGAGTVVFDCDKLLRIICSGNDYRNVDRVVRQIEGGRWIQSCRFSNEHFVGGAGPAFEVIESYDVSILNNLFEDRDAAWHNVTPTTSTTGFKNRNLRIKDNVIENMADTPVKISATWGCTFSNNYMEQNGKGKNADPAFDAWNGTPAHVDLYTVQPGGWHSGLILDGNMFSMRATQKNARTVSVLLGKSYQGRPVTARGNVADGGTLFKFGNFANAAAGIDRSSYVEAGDLVFPRHGSKVDGMHLGTGATSARPNAAPVGHRFFDTTTGKLHVVKTAATSPYASLRLTSGATAAGDVTITLDGTAYTVTVAAGDTLTQVRDKIVAAGLTVFYPWSPSASSTNVARFDSVRPGLVSAPSFNGGTTGVASDYFGLDQAGANAVWVNADGTAA